MQPILRLTRLRQALLATALCAGLIPLESQAAFTIQVGAFRQAANATGLAERLRTQGYPVTVTSTVAYHTVGVGPFAERGAADSQAATLSAVGLPVLVRRASVGAPSPAAPIQVAANGDETTGMEELFLETAPAEEPTVAPADDDLDLPFGDVPDTAAPAAPSEDMPDLDPDLEGLFAGTDEAEGTAAPRSALAGFFQSELAYTTADPEHWSKFRNLLELGSQGRFANGIGWKWSGRLVYDGAFDLEDDFYPSSVEDDRRSEAMVRETYLDIPAGDWDFRVGRQHIVWGEMVGLFFADVVSAKDLRQSVAQDFELLRIPQWALRAERFQGDLHMEAIWIPYMSYDDIGEAGDDFFPIPAPPPPGFTPVFLKEQTPAQKLSNSAYGLRLSYLHNGWDMSGFYYRSVDASAAFFRDVVAGPTPLLVYRPQHKKIHQLGATLAKDLGSNMVFKAEAIVTADKRFSVEDLSDADGVVEQDLLDYVLGLETTLDSGATINVQLFQRWFPDHVDNMIPDEVESGYSLYLTDQWFADRLEPELLWIQGFNQGDWMARPRLNWPFARDWRATLGADIFGGRSTTLFGQFDNADRVYAELRFTY